MNRIWIAALAMLAAQGCTKPPATAEEAPAAVADSVAWALTPGEARTVLAYGAAGLRFECANGSGKFTFTAPLPGEAAAGHAPGSKWLHTLMMQSRETVLPYPADTVQTDKGPVGTALGDSDDPVFDAFAASGEVSIDGTPQDADTPAELAAIRAFFKACDDTP